jgi:hypothetical protein
VAYTRPNPEREAYTRDILEQIDPQELQPWRERWEYAREEAIGDVRAELLEGAQQFAQEFADELLAGLPYLESDEQDAITAWFVTAPAAFRLGGPLERGDREAAAAEVAANYDQLVEHLFLGDEDRVALQDAMRQPRIVNAALKLWERSLRWNAEAIDRGVREVSETLWRFEPFQETLTPSQAAAGPESLHDEVHAMILEIFPSQTRRTKLPLDHPLAKFSDVIADMFMKGEPARAFRELR